MKKAVSVILILAFCSLCAFGFAGCGDKKQLKGEITEFIFKTNGRNAPLPAEYGLIYSPSDSSVTISVLRYQGEEELDVSFQVDDPSVRGNLMELINEYSLTDWDAFDGNDPSIAYGGGFSLTVKTSEGGRIAASGNNLWPDNFSAAAKAIDDFFVGLLP